MAENIQGLGAFQRKLKRLVRKRGEPGAVKAGFIGDATYPDGPSIVSVAALQEYGGLIRVPERMTTVYRSVREDGTFNKQGRFVKKRVSNFATDHVVPAHTIVIPPRAFMRTTFSEKRVAWLRDLVTLLRTDMRTETALGTLGLKMAEDIQATIRGWTEPPNAPSTIRKKKRNNPLEDTNTMLRAVTSEVDLG